MSAMAALPFFVFGLASASAQDWTQTSAPGANWKGVASSADGSKLVAVAEFAQIFTSTNAGATWTPNAPYTPYLVSVASSADGSHLLVSSYDWVHNYGSVHISTDSGTTWTNSPLFALSVAISADGTKLAAVATGGYMGPGAIYISTNYGADWMTTSAPVTNWSAIAASSSGTTFLAAASRLGGPFWSSIEGPIYVSTDSGVTWAVTGAPSRVWPSIACSCDGVKLVATSDSGIYTSTDSGATWTSNSVSGLGWSSVASSADAAKLVAAARGAYPNYMGTIYTSTNSGATWTASSALTNWTSVASSADGGRLVAAANGGIWTSQSTPSPLLNITRSDTNIVLSWIVPSMDFVLQENTDLTSTNWADVTNTATLNLTNLQNQVFLSLPPNSRFYRLKH